MAPVTALYAGVNAATTVADRTGRSTTNPGDPDKTAEQRGVDLVVAPPRDGENIVEPWQEDWLEADKIDPDFGGTADTPDPVIDPVGPDPIGEPGALAGAGYDTLAGKVGDDANLTDYSGIKYEASVKLGADGKPILDKDGNPISTQPEIEAGETFSNAESTVAGQLESILSKGSPLQQLAQSRAREQASALGMMSSSAGIGASQRALYDSAMPIAKQDAEQMGAFKLAEQEAKNEQDIINTEAVVAGDMLVHSRKVQDKALQTERKWNLLTTAEDTNVAERAKQEETRVARENAVITHEMNLELNQVPLDATSESNFTSTVAEATHDISTQISGALSDSTFVDNHVIYKPWGGKYDSDGEKILVVDKAASDAAWDRSMNTFIDVTKAGLVLDLKSKGAFTPERATEINEWASNVYRERGVQR